MNRIVSIVSPIYRSRDTIATLCSQLIDLKKTLPIELEIILVSDGCPDDSWSECVRATQKHDEVVAINLSRNFGQHNAIFAGLEHSKGEYVIVMDCDLQDRPDQIPILFGKAEEGYDVVFAQRKNRQDSSWKIFKSKVFYKILAWLTDTEQKSEIANFGIYSRKAIDSVISLQEDHRFFPTLIRWVGFKSTAIEVQHGLREFGQSSYSFSKLMTLGLTTIIYFSNKPLILMVKAGIVVALSSLLVALATIVAYFLHLISVPGWASVVVLLWFSFGINILGMGLLGLYIGATLDNSKNRPTYIVSEILRNNE